MEVLAIVADAADNRYALRPAGWHVLRASVSWDEEQHFIETEARLTAEQRAAGTLGPRAEGVARAAEAVGGRVIFTAPEYTYDARVIY